MQFLKFPTQVTTMEMRENMETNKDRKRRLEKLNEKEEELDTARIIEQT